MTERKVIIRNMIIMFAIYFLHIALGYFCQYLLRDAFNYEDFLLETQKIGNDIYILKTPKEEFASIFITINEKYKTLSVNMTSFCDGKEIKSKLVRNYITPIMLHTAEAKTLKQGMVLINGPTKINCLIAVKAKEDIKNADFYYERSNYFLGKYHNSAIYGWRNIFYVISMIVFIVHEILYESYIQYVLFFIPLIYLYLKLKRELFS